MTRRASIWVLSILLVISLLGFSVSLVLVYWQYRSVLRAWYAALPVTESPGAQPQAVGLILSETPFEALVNTRTPTPPGTVTPTNTFIPSPTASLTSTLTETPTPIPTDTPVPPTEAPPFPPESAYVYGVVGYPQSYSLDCEARSAVDFAAYFGISIPHMEFQNNLPISDDPDEGFVGNYWEARGQIPPASYGVHAAPVANLLRSYGLNAYDGKYLTWDQLRGEIASGRPVMVWVINNTLYGYPVQYTASNGHTTTVANFEHTVILIGYDPWVVTVVDNDLVYTRSVQMFQDSWSVLGNMAVLVSDPPVN